jgi:hypothetical protein
MRGLNTAQIQAALDRSEAAPLAHLNGERGAFDRWTGSAWRAADFPTAIGLDPPTLEGAPR